MEFVFENEARRQILFGISKFSQMFAVNFGSNRKKSIEEIFPDSTLSDLDTSISAPSDSYEKIGFFIGKTVVNSMDSTCQDGRITALIFLEALARKVYEALSLGYHPADLYKDLEESANKIEHLLQSYATPCIINEFLPRSVDNRDEIVVHLERAFTLAQDHSVIEVQRGKDTSTQVIAVDGIYLNGGLVEPHFYHKRLSLFWESPHFLITNQKILSIHPLLPLLQQGAEKKLKIAIVAPEFHPDVLSTLWINHIESLLTICPIQLSPVENNFQHLCLLTGGTLFDRDRPLSTAALADLGSAKSIDVKPNQIQIIKKSPESLLSISDKVNNPLVKGIVIISVGGADEEKISHRISVFEHYLKQVQLAKESGVILGGGLSFLLASQQLDTSFGDLLFKEALEAPMRQLIINQGLNPELLIQEIVSLKGSFGFNALSSKIENLKEQCILDPLKTALQALETSVLAIKTLFLSKVILSE